MAGSNVDSIELDQNYDGVPDRWEFYATLSASNDAPGSGTPPTPVILRAEERTGPGKPVMRLEIYEDGVLTTVEEDTDGNGRPNKWEHYENGRVRRVEFDLQGRGFPDRRWTYRAGEIEQVEMDPDGDGIFTPAPPR
jgi:hypothetical protein